MQSLAEIEKDHLDKVQRKIEMIIHNTPEEWRTKQPGVFEWRKDILRQITEYRLELVSRLKEVSL